MMVFNLFSHHTRERSLFPTSVLPHSLWYKTLTHSPMSDFILSIIEDIIPDCVRYARQKLVLLKGVEPSRLTAQVPRTCVAAITPQ